METKDKGLSDEELKRWRELKEQTKGARRKALIRVAVVCEVGLFVASAVFAAHWVFFDAPGFGAFVGGLVICVVGVGLLLWSVPRESTIALMCMGKAEKDPRVVADLERGLYYRGAGFGLVIVGLIAQLVGVVLGV